jgi:hypothetical protein
MEVIEKEDVVVDVEVKDAKESSEGHLVGLTVDESPCIRATMSDRRGQSPALGAEIFGIFGDLESQSIDSISSSSESSMSLSSKSTVGHSSSSLRFLKSLPSSASRVFRSTEGLKSGGMIMASEVVEKSEVRTFSSFVEDMEAEVTCTCPSEQMFAGGVCKGD